MHDTSAVELDKRDLHPRVFATIQLPGGVKRHQSGSTNLRSRVGNPVLHRLLFGERLTKRFPLQSISAHHLETPLSGTDPAHAMLNPSRAETCLGQFKSLSSFAEKISYRHTTAFESNLAVTTRPT